MDNFELAKQKGFNFGKEARSFMDTSDAKKMSALAMDAALVTTPNATVPAELAAYIDPVVIEILTAPRRARELYSEVKKGDWTTPYAKFRVDELTGGVTPYSDYADGAVAGVNSTFPSREQHVFQTTIRYGDFEVDVSSVAKMNLVSAKQKAAANAIDIAQNKYYLYGVTGKQTYGLLNDPNLNTAISPTTHTGGSSTLWADKTADEIYTDVLKLITSLRQESMGHIDENSVLTLACAPLSHSYMGKINSLGLSVIAMLKNLMGDKLKIVEIPELYSSTAGSTLYLTANEVMGNAVAQLAFGEKYHAHPISRRSSYFEQKISASCYGTILYYPFAVATMTGI